VYTALVKSNLYLRIVYLVVGWPHFFKASYLAQPTLYAALVGKRVEAYYRAGDVHLSAVGTLVTDNGKSISIEEHFSLSGKEKTLRVEIPYDFIIRVVQANGDAPQDSSASK
jgi:hypothetical protein